MKKSFKILTVTEAARQEKCCEETIRRACRKGHLKHIKHSSSNRIFISDYALKEWADKRGELIKEETIKEVRSIMEKE